MIHKKLLALCGVATLVLVAACQKDVYKEVTVDCPLVISTDPEDQATNVPTAKVISVEFNKAVDPATINASSIIVEGVTGTVTYSGTTASFTPSAPLPANTTFIGKIKTTVKDAQGNALQEEYLWTFSTAATIAPLVISVDPPDSSIGVVLNKTPSATFSMPMDPATINGNTFTLTQGTTPIAGTVSYINSTAYFNPTADFDQSTEYTATITTGAQNTFGDGLANDYVWTFTTGSTVAPTVILTDPADNEIDVALSKTVTAKFSEPMDPATINGTSFLLSDGGVAVAGVVTYNDSIASFNPTVLLDPNTLYIATITDAAENVAGTVLANDYVWAFTTVAAPAPTVISTDPADNDINVPLNKVVTVTFSEPMDPLTIDGTSFLLMDGATAVNGVVTYGGLIATFTPSSNLDPNTLYSATITTGAVSMAGTNLANDYDWTFTTAAAIAPTVISTDPADNDINVPLNKVVTVTFSEPMDPLTIDGTSFLLMDGATAVNGVVTYSGLIATFTPSSNLDPNTLYSATITTSAENMAGTGLANDYDWTFTTAAAIAPTVISTDPADNDINVPLNKVVTVTFSEPMDPLTIDGTSFLLMDGATAVNGVVTYSGLIATFTPSSNLDPNTLYSVTITTSAENMAGTGLANDHDWSFTTENAVFVPAINLNSVAAFGIISGVGVSNNAGPSQINNLDVGIYPGVRSSITGFFLVDGGPGIINNGDFYAADDAAPVPAMLLQAKNDLTAAYLAAEGASSPAPATVSGDLGGQTLAPGIYKSTSTLSIQNGNLTLDGQGDPNAEWIFQISSAFTTVGSAPFPSLAGGNVILIGGAQAKNVYWQVGSSATIGDYTSFNGNILALTSVTMNSFSQATGRMLCSNGAVTLTSTNIITKP